MKLIGAIAMSFAVLTVSTGRARASTIWGGPIVHFEKPDGADGTLPANQDFLTANVIFARGSVQGLYNAATESSFTHFLSPAGTEWESGTTATINPGAFTDWNTWVKVINAGPRSVIGKAAVVHLITDDIYLNITFTAWGGSGAAGFAYDRSSPTPSGPVTWTSTGSGNWSAGGNWSSGTAPNGAGQTAALNQGTTATVTATLDTPVTLGALALGNSGGDQAVGYSLSGTNALTLDNSGSNSLVSVSEGTHSILTALILNGNLGVSPSAGATLSIGGNISQSGSGSSLTMNGSGTLILSGSDSYTGGTIVKTGKLEVMNPNAVANGTNLAVGANVSLFPAATVPDGAPMSSPTAVPEPASIASAGIGVLCLLLRYLMGRRTTNRTAP
jgi:autotransporter-associated beta strand protein